MTDLDWPFYEPLHRDLAARLDGWARHNLTPHHGTDVDAACRTLVRGLGAAGFLELCVGRDAAPCVRSLAIARETLAFHSGLADFAFAMQGLGSGAISLFGTAANKERYLDRVARGEAIAAFALSEPQAGSDVAAMQCAAVRDGDDYIINGEKTWISNGGIADFYVVFARTGEQPGARGISAFIVDAGTPGFEIAEQTAVAQVLTDVDNPPPVPLDAEHAAVLATLQAQSGPAFDRAYILSQITGHQELLQIQQGYLDNTNRSTDTQHIAVLARMSIQQHLVMLQEIQQMLG